MADEPTTDDSTEFETENGVDGHRPAGLPENAVEPRCGDFVQLRHLEDPGLFKVSTTSRYRPGSESDNLYGMSEVDGDRVINMRGDEYVALFDTDKSAHWPVVFAKVDMMDRRRDTETGGITYYGEPLDAAVEDDSDDDGEELFDDVDEPGDVPPTASDRARENNDGEKIGSGGEWDPEPASLREGETRDDDGSHASRNAEQLRIAQEALEEADDVEPRTDGGVPLDDDTVDELEGERVIVQLRGAPAGETKRTGEVIEVHPERPNPDTAPEYVVDLDGAGQAYVTEHALLPVDEIPMSGVLLDTDDAAVAFDALQACAELASGDFVGVEIEKRELADAARTLGTQLALAGSDGGA